MARIKNALKRWWHRNFVEGTVGYSIGMLWRQYDSEVLADKECWPYTKLPSSHPAWEGM